MPAKLSFGFYQGSRSEYLATYLLSRIAVVTPVPRQSDFGLDLLCHLAQRIGGTLHVGAAFGVQVKSSEDPLCYPRDPSKKGNEEVSWLLQQSIPFFIAAVDREATMVRVYSTWPMTLLKYEYGHNFRQIRLCPGGSEPQRSFNSDTGVGEVVLGPPVIEVGPDKVEDNDTADSLAAVLEHWVTMELENYVNKLADVCYVRGHNTYGTNKHPTPDQLVFIASGTASLPAIKKRLAEAITITGHTLEQTGNADELQKLVGVLEFVETELDPLGQELLERIRPTSQCS